MVKSIALLLSLGICAAWQGLRAETYPVRPIRLLVGYAAGGPVDIGARQLAAFLQRDLAQSIVVENRPGAGGALAGEANAKAAPDGYSLLFAASPTQTTTPHLLGKLSWDPLLDYTPISLVSVGHNVLMVRADSSVRSVAELIAQARANPGKFSFGSAGVGASNHLAGELLARRAGSEFLHIPYKGNSQAMIGLFSGDTSFQFAGSTDAVEHVRSGRARALAVTASERLRVLPDVPTMTEAGIADFNVSVWYALQGPPRLPPPIVERLTSAVRGAMNDPTFVKALVDGGFDPVGASAEQLAARVQAEHRQWGDLIRTLKLN